MKILCIMTIWNEINFLPLKYEFCKKNGLDLYIIDNMSDDGSWEWIQQNNIPSHRFDTNGEFHLQKLQKEILATTHKLTPDWVIYNGCDLFPITLCPLSEYIENKDKEGITLLQIKNISFFNTGEDRSIFDPINTYFYYEKPSDFKMIYKYNPSAYYEGDNVIFSKSRLGKIDGLMINYGDTKPASQRLKLLERREKAWKNGENRGYGVHYINGKSTNWLWDKNKLIDIRKTDDYKFIQHLSSLYSPKIQIF